MLLSRLKEWRACILLLLLGLTSIAAGFIQIGTINETSLSNLSHIIPITVHVIAGIVFNLVSPFQFVASLRRRFPRVHRLTGRTLIVTGMVAALSALWMNQFFPQYGGYLKYLGIWAYCIVMFFSFYLAIKSIIKRDIQNHRKWMMHAMAAALGPATQRVLFIPIFIIFGEEVMTDVVIGSVIWFGLLSNLAFVQWLLAKEKKQVNKVTYQKVKEVKVL